MPTPEANLHGIRVGLLGFPVEMAETLGSALKSAQCLLFGPEEGIRAYAPLYLRADDIVFTPFALNELLFRIYRTIHKMDDGTQYSPKRRKPLVLVADDDPGLIMWTQRW